MQVIVSPIVEPPSATGLTSGITGATLYSQLSTVFGYLNSAGYCSAGSVCKRFPILLEIGSALRTLDDTLFMNDLANYMTLNGLGTLPHQHPQCLFTGLAQACWLVCPSASLNACAPSSCHGPMHILM